MVRKPRAGRVPPQNKTTSRHGQGKGGNSPPPLFGVSIPSSGHTSPQFFPHGTLNARRSEFRLPLSGRARASSPLQPRHGGGVVRPICSELRPPRQARLPPIEFQTSTWGGSSPSHGSEFRPLVGPDLTPEPMGDLGCVFSAGGEGQGGLCFTACLPHYLYSGSSCVLYTEHVARRRLPVSKALADKSVKAVREGELTIIPEFHQNTWFQWLENIQELSATAAATAAAPPPPPSPPTLPPPPPLRILEGSWGCLGSVSSKRFL